MASNERLSTSSTVGFSTEDVRKEYEFKDLLGTGATSKVYLGEHKNTGNLFAIKCVSTLNGERPEYLTNEIDILQMVKHPNIVGLVEVFENPSQVCLVMELVAGGELFDRIIKRGQYTEKDACNVVYQILDAVACLHEAGIVHRDLKLENVLCATPSDDAKIMLGDFGLSRTTGMEGKTIITTCGTPDYMAPEILLGEPYGNAVDVWAIGVITYILLCGYPPFYAKRDFEIFKKIKNLQYEFDSPYWDDISDDAKNFIRRLMDKVPEKRYTCRQAMQDPWICGETARTKNIQQAVSTNMKKNFARTKWKKVFNVATAALRMRKMNVRTSAETS